MHAQGGPCAGSDESAGNRHCDGSGLDYGLGALGGWVFFSCNSVRASLGIRSGAKLAAITDGERVLLGPLESPELAAFGGLIAESRGCLRRVGLKTLDVSEAIPRGRSANRARC